MDDESACFYVGSRGLLKSCDHRSLNPRSSSWSVDWDIQPQSFKDGDSIYICSSALSDFVNRILPTIQTRFILLTGDSDAQVPIRSLSSAEFDRLITDSRLIVWFSQNLIFSPKEYKKLQFLPIGLDYHTMANNHMYWGPNSSPKTQEDELFAVSRKARPLNERRGFSRLNTCILTSSTHCVSEATEYIAESIGVLHENRPIAYTTFHFAIHRGSRQQAYDQIPKDLVYYEPHQVSRLESWNRQIEYAFVVSPPGEGLDCHRTWEAICLGCIPIMISTPLDNMFDGLPVLIVKSWSDVTRELLDKTVAEYELKEFCLDKLQLKYWVDLVHSYRENNKYETYEVSLHT